MNSTPGIAHIACHFPAGRQDNAELAERFGFELEFLRDKVGVRTRAVAAPEETVSDLAAAAARKLFEKGVADPGEVQLLVVCTQTPDYRLPATANIVQHALGLPQTTAAFDIGQGCSGWVVGLSAVRSMMAAEGLDCALLITAETYSKFIDPADRATSPLFGDAAAATLLRSGAGGRIGRFVFGSDGSGAASLIIRGGGGRRPLDPPVGENGLRMDGKAIFNFMMRRVPDCVRRCLAANGLAQEDVDLFVFHQASRFMLANLAKHMGLPENKVPVVLEDTGNTVSSTIPATLERLAAEGRLAGRTVLAAGFGVGLSWAATTITFPKE
ncbi:MAG: ketoacyl-ACP synthase III [Thermodesulfobacteriota bacterium]